MVCFKYTLSLSGSGIVLNSHCADVEVETCFPKENVMAKAAWFKFILSFFWKWFGLNTHCDYVRSGLVWIHIVFLWKWFGLNSYCDYVEVVWLNKHFDYWEVVWFKYTLSLSGSVLFWIYTVLMWKLTLIHTLFMWKWFGLNTHCHYVQTGLLWIHTVIMWKWFGLNTLCDYVEVVWFKYTLSLSGSGLFWIHTVLMWKWFGLNTHYVFFLNSHPTNLFKLTLCLCGSCLIWLHIVFGLILIHKVFMWKWFDLNSYCLCVKVVWVEFTLWLCRSGLFWIHTVSMWKCFGLNMHCD